LKRFNFFAILGNAIQPMRIILVTFKLIRVVASLSSRDNLHIFLGIACLLLIVERMDLTIDPIVKANNPRISIRRYIQCPVA